MVTQTSIEAYYKLNLTSQQKAIMEVLAWRGPSCIADVAKILGWDKSTVSGRMNELKGVAIVMAGKQPSKSTGIMSEHWKIRERQETLF